MTKIRCRVCSRELKDPFYVKLGIGRVCAANIGLSIPIPEKVQRKRTKSVKIKSTKVSRIIKNSILRRQKHNPLQLEIPFKEYEHEEKQYV